MDRLTALFVTLQIIYLVNRNHIQLGGEGFPSPYKEFLESITFTALDVMDFLPTDCMVGGVNHLHQMLIITLSPILLFVPSLIYFFRATQMMRAMKEQMGCEWSLAEEWRPYARKLLRSKGHNPKNWELATPDA